ncbi:MAG: hypothetical protein WC349_02305 [Patescibacteria group bacterium]|jgi:hypothetical protein
MEEIISVEARSIGDSIEIVRQIRLYCKDDELAIVAPMPNGDLLIGKEEADGRVRQARYIAYNYSFMLKRSDGRFIFTIALLALSCIFAITFLADSFYYILGVILFIFFMTLLREAGKKAHKEKLKENVAKICENTFG